MKPSLKVEFNVLILELNSVFDHFLWFENDLQNESAKRAEFWLSPRKLHLKISKNQEIFD